MSEFYNVGQKIVCVKDAPRQPPGWEVRDEIAFPEVGKIYTVREIVESLNDYELYLRLEEIPDQIHICTNVSKLEQVELDLVWPFDCFSGNTENV